MTSFSSKWILSFHLVQISPVTSVFVYVRSLSKPPSERQLIENFYAHRAAYERLRDMFEADQHLLRVAKWGVETTESIGVHAPPEGDFPLNRYEEYLALLKETGATWAFRGKGEHPELVGAGVWAAGWGGTLDISTLFGRITNPLIESPVWTITIKTEGDFIAFSGILKGIGICGRIGSLLIVVVQS